MRILFVDKSTQLKTVRDLESRARGGMVTSLFKVTDYLARQGHHVTVWAGIEQEGQTPSGVVWRNEMENGRRYDVIVTNRGTGSGYPGIQAKHRVLWTHDLPHNGFIPEPATVAAYSCTVFMSRYAERVWRAFYPHIGKSTYIPNGVSEDFYPREKDLGYLIYASAPNRGLRDLSLIAEAIDHRVESPVYCRAYSNLAVLHPNEGDDTFDYDSVSDFVSLHDPLPQHKFAEEIGRAGLMLLPTDMPEICSNVVLQSLASGTPVITTGNLGSVCEWVKHKKNGMLTKYHRHDYMIHTLEMVRNSVEVLENEKLHRKLIRNAARTKIHGWEEIGRQWNKLIQRLT